MGNLQDGETAEIKGSGAKPYVLRNIEREVRTAPTSELAEGIEAKLIEESVKKGWEAV
jgi:hypothetical protein